MKMAKEFFIFLGLIALIVLLCVQSSVAKAGARSGLELCLNIIIPTLLPILILTSTMAKSSFKTILERIFGRLTQILFHLPRESTSAIIFGLIGGYPTGAVITKDLYDQGLIDIEQARRIMRFNLCGGIAFIITSVGTIRYGSTRLGIIAYLCSALACIILGVVDGIRHKNDYTYYQASHSSSSISSAFTSSVSDCVSNIMVMSGYIIFCSSLMSLVSIPNVFYPLLEITNGIFAREKSIPLDYLCFFLSFGGICIHLQIFGIIKEFEMKYTEFLIYRIIISLLSYFLGKAVMLVFPESISVFSNISSTIPKQSQSSIGLSIVLLFSCIAIVVDLKSRKSKLI